MGPVPQLINHERRKNSSNILVTSINADCTNKENKLSDNCVKEKSNGGRSNISPSSSNSSRSSHRQNIVRGGVSSGDICGKKINRLFTAPDYKAEGSVQFTSSSQSVTNPSPVERQKQCSDNSTNCAIAPTDNTDHMVTGGVIGVKNAKTNNNGSEFRKKIRALDPPNGSLNGDKKPGLFPILSNNNFEVEAEKDYGSVKEMSGNFVDGNIINCRKYIVLLQDALAIKFSQASQNSLACHSSKPSKSSAKDVNQSLHGLNLFDGFKEANLKCHWNSLLCEAINNLEYKGFLLPSIILIFAPEKFLYIIRTAWARQMLRSPAGYKIEFVGEIEELIAEPVQQGQFAPLSDSLCWAILELTSSGQEAFVDSIITTLSSSFPTMAMPNREIVYQTLEKLIRGKRIYQTSRGYFIVTPDTYRFMNAGSITPSDLTSYVNRAAPLDALMSSFYEPDRISLSQQSWASEDSHLSETYPKISTLRRHHSLKIIRQKDVHDLWQAEENILRNRCLSLRLPKSKSFCEGDCNFDQSCLPQPDETPVKEMYKSLKDREKEPLTNEKRKQKYSFFKRLFSFRSTRKRGRRGKLPPVPVDEQSCSKSLTQEPKNYSVSTQTLSKSDKSTLQNTYSGSSNASFKHGSSRGLQQICKTGDPIVNSNLQPKGSAVNNSKHWTTLPGGFRDWRVNSRKSLLDDSPLYEILTIDIPQSQINLKNKNHNSDGDDSKESMVSQSNSLTASLGYGSGSPDPNSNSPVLNINNDHCQDSLSYMTGAVRRRHKSGLAGRSSQDTGCTERKYDRPRSACDLKYRRLSTGSIKEPGASCSKECNGASKFNGSRCFNCCNQSRFIDSRQCEYCKNFCVREKLTNVMNADADTFINENGAIETIFCNKMFVR